MYTTHYYRCQHVPTYGSFAGQYGETFLLIHQASLSLRVPSTVLISYFALHRRPRDVDVLWLNLCYGSFENASTRGKGIKGAVLLVRFNLFNYEVTTSVLAGVFCSSLTSFQAIILLALSTGMPSRLISSIFIQF